MRCTPIRIGDVTGFVCGPSARRKRCSTPGCYELCDLECDAPIKRRPEVDQKWTPRIGDARVHLKRWRIYYVHHVKDPGSEVTLADVPWGQGRNRGVVVATWEDWYEKLAPTCNRAVCRGCRVRFGELDFCSVHGRMVQASVGKAGVLLAERGRDLFEILQSR